MKKLLGLLKSKTFWLNVVAVALALLDEGTIKCLTAEQKAAIIGILNVANRFLTNKPLEEK